MHDQLLRETMKSSSSNWSCNASFRLVLFPSFVGFRLGLCSSLVGFRLALFVGFRLALFSSFVGFRLALFSSFVGFRLALFSSFVGFRLALFFCPTATEQAWKTYYMTSQSHRDITFYDSVVSSSSLQHIMYSHMNMIECGSWLSESIIINVYYCS